MSMPRGELPYAETIVGQYWPLHGPYDPEHTKRAGSVLSELVRYLNYATQHPEALPYAADIGDLVGTLQATAGSLRQTLEQLDGRCADLVKDPNLYDHSDRSNRSVALNRAERAGDELIHAARRAAGLSKSLGEAHQALAFLGHRDPGEDS
jgi:hypothetical protein